jgi:hypothetical protein
MEKDDKMKVKLLKVDLIRTFGGSIVNMSDSQAAKYISKGLAVEYKEPVKNDRYASHRKGVDAPPEDKKVWSPPEKKLFNDQENGDVIFPGPEDKLFPQINK